MSALKKYTPFFASAMLMWLVLYVVYPHYQYYVDPDGTAYLTISKRYANGDYARAINGYWSPWSCWLTALLIKAGLQPIPASVVINAIGATGFLYISHSFFLKFNILQRIQWLLNITLAFFLVYAIFWQSFDDLWECFFLLSTLRIMLAERFLERPVLWITCGMVGALAYFAKAYSFPFFILNTICCTFLLARLHKGKWLLPAAVAIITMIACGLPWIWLLHHKYGTWTTSTAGTLNTSWYLVGHPIWKDGMHTLLPPPYPDSPYYWEDPWFVNGPTPHFWDSWKLFGMQIVRVGYNAFKQLRSMVALSLVFPLITIFAFAILLRKRIRDHFTVELQVVALSILLFPLGYLLINYESRYLWYMVPLSMVVTTLAISSGLFKFNLSAIGGTLLLAISFLVIPAWQLLEMDDEGAREYELATKMKSLGIQGSFTSNARQSMMSKVAYFSGQPYYPPTEKLTSTDLFHAMRKNNIRYCLVYLSRDGSAMPYFEAIAKPEGAVRVINLRESHSLMIYQMW